MIGEADLEWAVPITDVISDFTETPLPPVNARKHVRSEGSAVRM